MEIFSALLAICAGNSPVPGEFPAQKPVTRSVDVFFDLHPNKRLSKQWRGWWFKTPSCPLLRHRNGRGVTDRKFISLWLSMNNLRNPGNEIQNSHSWKCCSEKWSRPLGKGSWNTKPLRFVNHMVCNSTFQRAMFFTVNVIMQHHNRSITISYTHKNSYHFIY